MHRSLRALTLGSRYLELIAKHISVIGRAAIGNLNCLGVSSLDATAIERTIADIAMSITMNVSVLASTVRDVTHAPSAIQHSMVSGSPSNFLKR